MTWIRTAKFNSIDPVAWLTDYSSASSLDEPKPTRCLRCCRGLRPRRENGHLRPRFITTAANRGIVDQCYVKVQRSRRLRIANQTNVNVQRLRRLPNGGYTARTQGPSAYQRLGISARQPSHYAGKPYSIHAATYGTHLCATQTGSDQSPTDRDRISVNI
jgi:hypothetical protein